MFFIMRYSLFICIFYVFKLFQVQTEVTSTFIVIAYLSKKVFNGDYSVQFMIQLLCNANNQIEGEFGV